MKSDIMRKLIFLLLISASTAMSASTSAVADYSKQQALASRYYENGEYSKAHNEYKDLARDGDRFAQYRLSYMYLMGEGKKEDLIESLAWSVLAAQDRHEDMVAYMQTVAEMVPQSERKKANKKISYYMRKWGDASSSGSSRGDEVCTGSRLCNHKTGSGNVGIPSNLWNVGNSGNEQELKTRAMDINEMILKSHGVSESGSSDNEAS